MSSSAKHGSGLFSSKSLRKPHLARRTGNGGLPAEVAAIREDISDQLGDLAGIVVEEFIDVPAADTDAFKTSIATVAAAVEYAGTDLNGVVGTGALTPPRPVSVTASDSALSYAGSVTFEGVDVYGAEITEDVAITNNATTTGNKMFARVTKISIPAQNDTSGTLQFGFGAKMGLRHKILSRAGLLAPVKEIAVGAVVTTGTFQDAAAAPPFGSYSPASAANGTRDYCLYYEADFSLASRRREKSPAGFGLRGSSLFRTTRRGRPRWPTLEALRPRGASADPPRGAGEGSRARRGSSAEE